MTNWIYKGKQITCLEDITDYEKIVGFIYKIQNIKTKKLYIGKKILHNSRKTRISKKEKLELPTRKVFKKVIKESNWKEYYGSCLSLLDEIKVNGKDKYKREILKFCYSKKELAYCELEYQVKEDVLRKDTYNGNILTKFFRKDLNESI